MVEAIVLCLMALVCSGKVAGLSTRGGMLVKQEVMCSYCKDFMRASQRAMEVVLECTHHWFGVLIIDGLEVLDLNTAHTRRHLCHLTILKGKSVMPLGNGAVLS